MESIFSVPDLPEDPFSSSLNPFGFSDIDSLNELDSIKNSFMDNNIFSPFRREYECYVKDPSYFSDEEKENDHALKHDQSMNADKREDRNDEPLAKDLSNKSKSCALTKIALLGQTSITTNVEHSSVTSHSSEDRASKDTVTKPFENKSEEIESIDSFGVYNVQEKDSSEFIDEGNLVFLIRKIDKKTKKSKLLTKHRKKITKCPHRQLEYYAKGMCKNCYHNKGKRSKKASKCDHKERDHYAKGLCKNCYLHFFHIKKKQRKASEMCNAKASI